MPARRGFRQAQHAECVVVSRREQRAAVIAVIHADHDLHALLRIEGGKLRILLHQAVLIAVKLQCAVAAPLLNGEFDAAAPVYGNGDDHRLSRDDGVPRSARYGDRRRRLGILLHHEYVIALTRDEFGIERERDAPDLIYRYYTAGILGRDPLIDPLALIVKARDYRHVRDLRFARAGEFQLDTGVLALRHDEQGLYSIAARRRVFDVRHRAHAYQVVQH